MLGAAFRGLAASGAVQKGQVLPVKMALHIVATFFQAGASSGFSSFLIPLMLMFGIMYFMVIMPQQKQRKKVQEMLSAIKAGDRVITNGGIYGTINGIDGDSVILKIATDPQVKIRVARSAIAQVETPEDAK
jgi:preprotein translocase subunit YajC